MKSIIFALVLILLCSNTANAKNGPQAINVGDAAGGDLAGTYPNPSIANGAVTAENLAAPLGTAGQVLTLDENGGLSWSSPPVLSGYEVVNSSTPNNDTAFKAVVANCPTGKAVVGGGFSIGYGSPNGGPVDFPVFLQTSAPNGSLGWRVQAHSDPTLIQPGAGWSVTAFAVCVNDN